jgi:metal-responsive CopG/Arc/MetJ family transcriptional regulator
MSKNKNSEVSTQVTLYLNVSLLKEIDDYSKALCEKNSIPNVSRSWIIQNAIKEYLKDKKCQ